MFFLKKKLFLQSIPNHNNMKKFLYAIIILQVLTQNIVAQETKSIHLSFNLNDFSFSYDTLGLLNIMTSQENGTYEDTLSSPAIPFFPINILIPQGFNYVNSDISMTSHLLYQNIILSENTIQMPTDSTEINQNLILPQYTDTIYPSQNVTYVNTEFICNCTVLRFVVCPFIYNTHSQSLTFIDSLDINLSLDYTGENTNSSSELRDDQYKYLQDILTNPEDLDNYGIEEPTCAKAITWNFIPDYPTYEYAIITDSTLAPAFEPLIRWKKTKGLWATIITKEEIENTYSGATTQIKIKKCLRDLYQYNNLKFALLGGDDTIIPTLNCYGIVNKTNDPSKKDKEREDFKIPTDLFYACFNDNFEWNADGDSIYGETTDSISMVQDIYLTRIPIRTTDDVNAFIQKLLLYEISPTTNGWNHKMLMAGTKLWNYYPSGQSDAQVKGDYLFNTYIAPHWDGERKVLFDTTTSFEDGENYNLTPYNLTEQIGSGYHFIDLITHGSQTKWSMENGYYTSSNASLQNNAQPSIVTTMACLTNAFDNSDRAGDNDPCLSEALIRNPNSGVVAYLGCSREGWGNSNTSKIQLGTSLLYESAFYYYLFDDEIKEKNFGLITSLAKSSRRMWSYTDGSNRWVQFGLNPIGDPEMPIYTTTPMSFTNDTIIFYKDSIVIDTGVDNCRICVTSTYDNGNSYFSLRNNCRHAAFYGLTNDFTVCVTKQNYIPIIKQINLAIIQNEIINGTREYEMGNGFVIIGRNVTHRYLSGDVLFKTSSSTDINADAIIIDNGTTIERRADFIMNNP